MRSPLHRHLAALFAPALLALALACQGAPAAAAPPPPSSETAAAPAPAAAAASRNGADSDAPLIPELRGIHGWLNSEPMTIEELRGKVVLVDFMTYTCINCIRTLPYVKDWNDKYASRGLVILGIQAPEFEFEKDLDNVRVGITDLGVTWPVAVDNDMETWRAYSNRYWPHKYLADAQGRLRYHHIGEGAYLETEQQIRDLLTEAGQDVSDIPLGRDANPSTYMGPITREVYAGSYRAFGEYLGNPPPGGITGVAVYDDPRDRKDGKFYLHGPWDVGEESVRLSEPADDYGPYIAAQFLARSVNVVIQPRNDTPMRVLVTMGKDPVPQIWAGDDVIYGDDGRSYLDIEDARMYSVIRGPSVEQAELRIFPTSDDFQLFTYTFGK